MFSMSKLVISMTCAEGTDVVIVLTQQAIEFSTKYFWKKLINLSLHMHHKCGHVSHKFVTENCFTRKITSKPGIFSMEVAVDKIQCTLDIYGKTLSCRSRRGFGTFLLVRPAFQQHAP